MTQPKNNHHENLEEVFYNLLSEGLRSDSPYDYLVLFSGGKDSTYLAHILKQAAGGRVCLFSIDNGFEDESFTTVVKETAYRMETDLYIYQPPREAFMKYYNFLITENQLKKIDSNPLCFFCGRYFMALGLEFAERNNIPFVIYGATPMQVSGRKIARTLRDLEIFKMVSKRVLMEFYKKIQSVERYKSDPDIKRVVDKVFYLPKNTTLIFPFQYLQYNIDMMKRALEDEYGWQNPTQGLSNEEYLTSGCQLVNLFGVLAKNRGFVIHELKQFESDYSDGIMGEAAYEYNKRLFEKLMEGKVNPSIEQLAKVIGINDILCAALGANKCCGQSLKLI